MTTVLMVSGSWPPQVCGVGDYSEKLCHELEQSGISVVRLNDDRLSRLYSREVIRGIAEVDCDLIHIQYPTAGYGRSFTPSALAANVRSKPVVVTLHEYSVFRWYRRSWFAPFSKHCDARIFTTDEERTLFEHRFARRNGIDLTVEIASNIPIAAEATRDLSRVSYFGLIAPNKGIEAFLDLCETAGSTSMGLTFELVGAIPEHHRRYADSILRRASARNVHLSIDLPDEAVASRLRQSTFAYLPFPDGASAKRGTLAAAIVNELIVITQHSHITPEWIRLATLAAKTPENALKVIMQLQADGRQREAAAQRSALAAARFRWDVIAQRHVSLYQRLLNIPAMGEGVVESQPMTPSRYESRLAS